MSALAIGLIVGLSVLVIVGLGLAYTLAHRLRTHRPLRTDVENLADPLPLETAAADSERRRRRRGVAA